MAASNVLCHHKRITPHTTMSKTAITFLIELSGLAARFILDTAALHQNATIPKTSTKPVIYASMFNKPVPKSTGSILLTNTINVGEQVLNSGHSTAHKIISSLIPFHEENLWLVWLVFLSNQVKCIIFHRNVGKSNVSPKSTNITADIVDNVSGYIPNWSTKNLMTRVNTSTDIANDSMIIPGRDFFPSLMAHPIITGRSGSTQGAKMVSSHATNDSISRLIFCCSEK